MLDSAGICILGTIIAYLLIVLIMGLWTMSMRWLIWDLHMEEYAEKME